MPIVHRVHIFIYAKQMSERKNASGKICVNLEKKMSISKWAECREPRVTAYGVHSLSLFLWIVLMSCISRARISHMCAPMHIYSALMPMHSAFIMLIIYDCLYLNRIIMLVGCGASIVQRSAVYECH